MCRLVGSHLLLCVAVASLSGVAGCEQPAATSDGPPASASPTVFTGKALQQELDEVLDFTFQERHLSTQEHAAWQILHGALAYKREFQVRHADLEVSAVDHLLEGGYMKGWTTQPGVWLDKERTRRGLRALLEEGSKAGQGHADQWLAVLAQSELPPEQAILVAGRSYTMQDFVAQVQYDVPRNVKQEYSWTLIGLTTYLPTDSEWTAADDKTWTIERLVQIEAEQDLATSACGGTHRVIGMAMALNRHLEQGGQVEGGWKLADERIREAIENARAYQNPDGSFSTNYFERAGNSADLKQKLGTSGHILEFLTLALTVEELQEPWIERAVSHMCHLFRKTRKVPLECGALYHAAHGLTLYRERVFGRRTYSKGVEPAKAATTAAANSSDPK